MKILIVDDQAGRYKRLIAEIESLGISRKDVSLATCANDARSFLEVNSYDLLLLDLLLPLWPESDEDIKHSLDLLMEIHETDAFNKPGMILGITADPDVSSEVIERLEEWTWQIVHFSEASDEWLTQILNCVRYIRSRLSSADRTAKYGIDLAVVCALETPELDEVLKLPWNWAVARPIDDNVFVRDGWFEVGGRRVIVAATVLPRMGMVAAALHCAALIVGLRPKLLVMCGICAGVRGKTNVGEVLLADPAWDYQSGKRVAGEDGTGFFIAPHQLYSPLTVRSHVEQIRADFAALTKLSSDYGSDSPGLIRVRVGPVASGSAVLADGQTIASIADQQHRELLGIEMEAYGVYAAANAASKPQPSAFALKAVCDFADPAKSYTDQRFAAYASANVLRLLMERFAVRLLS